MRAAIIQLAPGAERAANIAQARPLLLRAVAEDNATLVSLPEMWTCLGGDRATKLEQAEILPAAGPSAGPEAGPATGTNARRPVTAPAQPGTAYEFLQLFARTHGVIVHGGSIGERAGDTLYNTSLLFGPDGSELARYRKIHLFDVVTPSGTGYRESALFGAGSEVVVASAGGLTLGLSICYDLRFPELYLALRRRGAAVIFVPSAFTAETGRDHWEVLLRARAIETQCWIVAAATTGEHHDARGQPRMTWGHAMIVDPWGAVRAQLGSAPDAAAADIDIAQLERVRGAMPVLAHRRLA